MLLTISRKEEKQVKNEFGFIKTFVKIENKDFLNRDFCVNLQSQYIEIYIVCNSLDLNIDFFA